MKYKIEVKDLGMNKVSKTVKVDKIDYETLYGVVKPHLHSDLIDFYVGVEDEWGTEIGRAHV